MFEKMTAEECNKVGVDIILSGMGFDDLLCESPSIDETKTFPNSWYSWMLDDNWFNENIYKEYGITYKSAAASQLLIKLVWSMRKGQGKDLKKMVDSKFF